MGQFLGFPNELSSFMSNNSNLKTHYISPQFNVDFDDLFQNVFSYGDDDIMVDDICNQVIWNDNDLYAENKFNEEGELIYSPPPLDKVWPFMPECQHSKKSCKPNAIIMKNVNTFRFAIPQLSCFLILLLILLLFQMVTQVLILLLMLSFQNQRNKFILINQMLQMMVIPFLKLVKVSLILILIHHSQSFLERKIIMKMTILADAKDVSGSNSHLGKMIFCTNGCIILIFLMAK